VKKITFRKPMRFVCDPGYRGIMAQQMALCCIEMSVHPGKYTVLRKPRAATALENQK